MLQLRLPGGGCLEYLQCCTCLLQCRHGVPVWCWSTAAVEGIRDRCAPKLHCLGCNVAVLVGAVYCGSRLQALEAFQVEEGLGVGAPSGRCMAVGLLLCLLHIEECALIYCLAHLRRVC